ncbi:hypothetical protein [Flammeovirga aprica]|uniref:Tetratricopeptide repeat protein n=1 Tax=Flammeovirga aprica JL-4 TaxID=694437 RepID=A0A7X9RWY2_9BACT|nr:hypothetical protein [Flammeovirga aprica]NME70222.1 hypothetical protein [Flammeovirga aprica JL-4]
MKKIILLMLLANLTTIHAQDLVFKKHSIAHQLLELEEKAFEHQNIDYKNMYSIIDSVIKISSIKITAILNNDSLIDEKTAIKIFEAIDETLIELDFITFIRIERLNQALLKTIIPKESLKFYKQKDRRVGNQTYYYFTIFDGGAICMTEKRLNHFQSSNSNSYYRIDCDLGAYLYLAVAEVNDLPIYLVEVPGHNFLRFQLNSNEYVNWDNNVANTFSNDDYKNGMSPTVSEEFLDMEASLNHYLENMNNDEVIGYHLENVARYSIENSELAQAEKQLIKSIQLRPYSASARNELAWMYLTEKEFRNKEYAKMALSLATETDSINPSNPDYKDTYACACAANKDYKKAIELEKQGYNDEKRINAYKKRKNCYSLEKIKEAQ